MGGSFTVLTLSPEVAYRFPYGLSFRVRAPLHWKVFDETSPEVHREKVGLGDLELLASYDLFHRDDPERPRLPYRLALSAGAALPTGEHVMQPFVGEVAPTALQLGSGTVDPLLAVWGLFAPSRRWSVDAGGTARIAVMANACDYRPASVVDVGIGGAYRPLPDRLAIDLHGEWSHVTRVEVGGAEVSNTGRDTLYLVPGASVRIWQGLSAGLSVRVPLYMRVNERQFAEDVLLALRLVYRTPPLFGASRDTR